jgi:hypothetical protein
MKILKYIITDKEEPIIFSSKIQHDTILKPKQVLIVMFDIVNNKFIAKCFERVLRFISNQKLRIYSLSRIILTAVLL